MTSQDTTSSKTSGYITIDGIKLKYLIEGEGIRCLVISTNSNLHQPLFSSVLKKHIKFIFVDTKIFVPSTTIDVDRITMDTIVDDVEKTRISLGFEKIAVMGPSAYGLIALEYARKYPKQTSFIVMIGTFPNFNTEIRKKREEFWESNASEERKEICRTNNETLTEEILNKVSPREALAIQCIANTPYYWYDPRYDQSWFWEIEYNWDSFSKFFEEILRDYDSTQTLYELKKPLFLALGKYDYVAPYVFWDDLINNIPHLS